MDAFRIHLIMEFKLSICCHCLMWTAGVFLSHFTSGQSTINTRVARAIPFSDKSLTGTPVLTYSGVSKLRCIVECGRINCSSFNFGAGTCELLETYVCEQTASLVDRINFKHYDVEFGVLVQDADTYRQTADCTTQGKCSPKCFPATTTAVPTLPPPEPGEVNYTCSSDLECNVTKDCDCRNGVVCECIAGYSHNPVTKTCDNGCTTLGTSYFKTRNYELAGVELWQNASLSGITECQQECDRHTFCKVITWNIITNDCYIFDVSKLDAGASGAWVYNGNMQYWQRNCAD